VTPESLALIAVGLGAAGTAKLAGANFTKENFARWGYPAWSRSVVGAIEVGIAAAAISALRDPEARPVAALGTLCAMTGAVATHAHAGDSAPNYLPPIGLAAAAVATLVGR
jgi:DoxX-like family